MPMFLGFAGPEALDGKWNHISSSSNRLVNHLFAISAASAQDDDDAYSFYREAYDVLKNQYYGDPIDAKKSKALTFAAIRGMLYSLNDPFTSFLDREEWSQMQQTTRGDFDGIGAVLEPFGQDVRVVRPIPETPAYKAGIKANDIVMKVGTFNSKGL